MRKPTTYLLLLACLLYLNGFTQERVTFGHIPDANPSPPLIFALGQGPITINDPLYANASIRPHIGAVKTMQNVVMLKIHEEATDFIPADFTAVVKVTVRGTLPDGSPFDEGSKELRLVYKLGMGQKSDAASYFVKEYGGYSLTAEIVDIEITSANTSWDFKKVLQLETQIRSEYEAPFDYNIAVPNLRHTSTGNTAYDDIEIKWDHPSPHGGPLTSYPTDYDLEWAWVDESAADNFKTNNNWDPAKIFFNNATRVTIPVGQQAYRSPVFYDGSGYFFYRIRAVRLRLDGQVINGKWTTDDPAWATNLVEGEGLFTIEDGHEEGLNWQVSTTFAEEGKKKTVIQYHDGRLMGRQTVTKDNSIPDESHTVVAETFYDYQGRPTIQVLPAPTLNAVISFTKNFNNANLPNTQGYPKLVYDVLTQGQNACDNGAPALSTALGANGAHGAGNYYSSLNPNVNAAGFDKYIPNANGFAFTETRYTQDATGRIAAQSGVGEAFRLGSGHETKYFYTAPTQDELDLLFGTDAGVASHYEKNYVRDANGQYSVSYVDMHGRTVATALAGNPPSSLEALASYNAQPAINSPDNAIPKQMLSPETNVVDGRSIRMVKEIVVTSSGAHKFTYTLNPEELKLKNCNDELVLCYDCLYDLTIVVTDNCDNSEKHRIEKKNFTLPHTNVCDQNPNGFAETFILTLAEGTYTITKILTLNKDMQDLFREQAMQPGNLLCKTLEQFKEEIGEIMNDQNENCKPTCESCTTQLAGGETAFRASFMQKAGLTEGQMAPYEAAVTAAYNQAKADCDAICESGSDRVNNFRQLMLMDMMPDRGQYARILSDEKDINGNDLVQIPIFERAYNIFEGSGNDANGSGKFKKPKTEGGADDRYRDEYGAVDIDAEQNLTNWTKEQFTHNFKESWADQLLYYHPEFNKLKLTETEPVKTHVYRWQEQLQNKTKWSEVSSIVTGLPGSDPFYATILSGNSLQADMLEKLTNGVCIQTRTTHPLFDCYSMWRFALAAVVCKDEATIDQLPCLEACTNTIGSFPNGMCDADKDMVWQVFSSLYFREREIFVYRYLQQVAYVNPDIFNPQADERYPRYIPRFMNPDQTGMQSQLPANLQNLFTQATNTASPGSNSQAVAALEVKYEDNCRSYAVQWLDKLHIFDQCKTGITNSQYEALIEQLVSICTRGSDLEHPLGSSSISPTHPNQAAPTNFEAAISGFMTANAISATSSCHPYILDWPKPYDRSPMVANEELWETKPDECVCARVNALHTQYLTSTGYSNFSDFMYIKYGTNITETVLQELLSLCDEEADPPACRYRSEPIVLPPALQCGASNEVCIDCDQYTTFTSAFYTQFANANPPANLPIGAPTTTAEENWNNTFANFMNHKTGFNKLWPEYVTFAFGCLFNQEIQNNNVVPGICSRFTTHITNFYTALPTLVNPGDDCATTFTNYFNAQEGTRFTYEQLRWLYKRCNPDFKECDDIVNCCVECRETDSLTEASACSVPPATHLCGLNLPIGQEFEIEPDDPCDDVVDLILVSALIAWEEYKVKIKNDFDKAYQDKCLTVQNIESFTVQSANDKEYHYTLYYYDQSGHLVQTVPPAGVDDHNYSQAQRNSFLTAVKNARTAGTAYRPAHTLPTVYRYNTLGQVVEQKSPDGGRSKFWYDELGRLVVSQNAKQAAANKYSYTIYDDLGRISQVGQKPSTDPMSQSISRKPTGTGSLGEWLSNGQAKEQITRTVYDIQYENNGVAVLDARLLVQRNLRNRVSYTQVVPVEPNSSHLPDSWVTAHSTATYYTYDIHGNVDELVQDYNEGIMKTVAGGANRFKKMAYTYDLISGKVNTVIYQPDYYNVSNVLTHHPDRFYHRYEYDAENKLTEAETSRDGIIWQTDARYQYYRHGPLARTVLGEQQVQGIDYAYTLQGWLKGVNSTAISAAPSEDCAPGTGRDVLDVINRQQYGQPTNYVARREINFDPEFESDMPDDFMAYTDINLQPCVPVIAPTPYITGDMGVDGGPGSGPTQNPNRFVARDAFSFSLNYYTTTIGGQTVNDYQSINNTVQPFALQGMFNVLNTDSPTPQLTAKPLFNGNIASMFVNIPKLGEAHLYGYKYDQLNRIVAMDAFKGFSPGSNSWTGGNPVATTNYKEIVSYDANGNILTYLRNGSTTPPASGSGSGGPLQMDQLTYGYNTDVNGKLTNNRLRHVKDAIGDANYQEDIDNQADDNYEYDEIGNLVKDIKEGITNIEWNVYGKISSITKVKSGETTTIAYTYDAGGNRISKVVTPPIATGGPSTTIYVRDASGNVMSVYEKLPLPSDVIGGSMKDLIQAEVHLYGSSRLGIVNRDVNVENPVANTIGIYSFERGSTVYELSNHLGNVLVTVSDRKIQVSTNNTTVAYYTADVATAVDGYSGGMEMPGRKFEQAGSSYRYSINGQEKTPEIGANSTTAEFWQYDARIVRRWNVDPIVKEYESSYLCFAGNPVLLSDVNGDHAGGNCPVCGKEHSGECADPKTANDIPYVGYVRTIPQQGNLVDWLSAVPNGLIKAWNWTVVDFTNGTIKGVNSIKNGTFFADLADELNVISSGINNSVVSSWNYTWNTPFGVQLEDSWNALKNPQTLENGIAFLAPGYTSKISSGIKIASAPAAKYTAQMAANDYAILKMTHLAPINNKGIQVVSAAEGNGFVSVGVNGSHYPMNINRNLKAPLVSLMKSGRPALQCAEPKAINTLLNLGIKKRNITVSQALLVTDEATIYSSSFTLKSGFSYRGNSPITLDYIKPNPIKAVPACANCVQTLKGTKGN